ncbi:MAG: PAS domain S-box protein [Syntrophales bacterium]
MEKTELTGSAINDLALSILNAAPLATFGLENRRIIFANRAVERIFGWKPEELIGQSTRILYANDEEYEKAGKEVYPTLENGPAVLKSVFECRHKDGGIIICRLSATRIGDSLVNRKVVVTFEDISELKKIESRLLESEKLYRTLAESSFAGVYLIQDGKFKYVNEQAASYMGYKPHELVGRKAHSIVHPNDRKMIGKFAREMLKGKRTTPYSYRALDRKGRILWFMETVTGIVYEGRPAVLGTTMDITELREAKIEIEEFNKLRSSILDATPHAIMYLEDRRIIFANNAVESVFGWKPEELIGNSTRMLFLSDEDFERMGHMAYSTLERRRVYDEPEFLYRHKSGEPIYCRIKAVRIGERLSQKRSLIVTYENITEQKKTQDALRQRTKELELKTQNLEEANIALNVILKKREADKLKIEKSVVDNIRELIMPCIQQMKKYHMDDEALKYASLAESYLNDIVSPFLHKLSIRHLNLTHREVLIASLLKDGKSSKEIGDLLNISSRGVDYHRNKIRKKLGLKHKRDNLRSYLISCFSDDTPEEGHNSKIV